MARIEKKTCLLYENKVCKLLRHAKLVHSEATSELIAELVASQRKKRSDSKSSNRVVSDMENQKKYVPFYIQRMSKYLTNTITCKFNHQLDMYTFLQMQLHCL